MYRRPCWKWCSHLPGTELVAHSPQWPHARHGHQHRNVHSIPGLQCCTGGQRLPAWIHSDHGESPSTWIPPACRCWRCQYNVCNAGSSTYGERTGRSEPAVSCEQVTGLLKCVESMVGNSVLGVTTCCALPPTAPNSHSRTFHEIQEPNDPGAAATHLWPWSNASAPWEHAASSTQPRVCGLGGH